VLEASGVISLADTQRATIVLFQKVARVSPITLAMVAFGVIVGVAGSVLMVDFVAPGLQGIALVATAAVLALATYVQARLRMRAYFKGLLDRGIREASPATYRLRDDGLHVSGDNLEMVVQWRGVSEIALGPTFWCVVGPGVGFCLPRLFFETQDAERAFIRGMLERVAEPARERSRDATEFVGVWG